MEQTTSDIIDQQIAARLQEIEVLKVAKLAADNPKLRALMQQALGMSQAPAIAPRQALRVVQDTAFDRMVRYLNSTGNEPATIKQLAERANCSESAVRQVIYQKNSDRFEKAGSDGKSNLFRLAITEMEGGGSNE